MEGVRHAARPRSSPCAGSTWSSNAAASPRSWARPAPASPPSCTAWPASTRSPAARSTIGETTVTGLGDSGLTKLRRDKVGFIFQQFNLLPTLTAEENILLPLSIAGRKPDPDWFDTVIDTVGLGDRLGHRPAQLSGGQQQRVACARALVARPEVIFADEPTGNLDSRSGAEVLSFLRNSVREHRADHRHGHPRPRSPPPTPTGSSSSPTARSSTDLTEPTAETVLDTMKRLDILTAEAGR